MDGGMFHRGGHRIGWHDAGDLIPGQHEIGIDLAGNGEDGENEDKGDCSHVALVADN